MFLYWLALLLSRIFEAATGSTWRLIRDKFHLLTMVTFTGRTGTFHQRDILAKLDIPTPKTIVKATPVANA
ncbi:transposase [Nonomuraea sp. SYSU D8015]|uniref:transposase n=1 Tax=Nonomuraea sp. SYSU D8015 TaxID=2593644 RepID=UPI001660D2DA|nr:transposase [Nonomuraea sp. SYSU D8015]